MRTSLSALLLSSIVLLTACSDDKLVVAPLPQVANQFSLTTNYTRSIGNGFGGIYSALKPSVNESNQLFIAARDGSLVSLELATGKELWRTKIGSQYVTSGVAVGPRGLYLGTDQGELIALDFQGKPLWTQSGDGNIISTPLTTENAIIANSSRGLLVAYNPTSGEPIWSIHNQPPKLTLRGDSSPITDGATVYWGTSSGRLTAARLSSGSVSWQQPLGAVTGSSDLDRITDADASPVLSQGRLYGSAYNGYTTSMDPKTGQIAWRSTRSTAKDFLVSDSELVLVNESDHIIALDKSTGKELWENKLLENRNLSAPALFNNFIVVGDIYGYLHFIDRKTGTFVAQFSTDSSGVSAQPLVQQNQLIVYTRGGKLYSFQIGNK